MDLPTFLHIFLYPLWGDRASFAPITICCGKKNMTAQEILGKVQQGKAPSSEGALGAPAPGEAKNSRRFWRVSVKQFVERIGIDTLHFLCQYM